MRHYRRLAAVSVLTLAIAACGGPAEEEAAPVEAEEAMADEVAVVDEGEAVAEDTDAAASADADAAEAEAPEAESTAASTPAPAAPTQVAAPVGPPPSFTQCQVCHQVAPGQNGIGPSLAGVFGRKAGAVSGFSYTEGMRNSGLTWNEGNLDRYLAGPSALVPGTTMAVGPLDAAQRKAIIDYLKTL